MSLKRAPDDTIEERPVQRPRVQEGDIEYGTPLSLDDINDNCILEIFKYLSVEEELNSTVVFISSRYLDLRNHDSLDQTRTGTIVCTERTTLESIYDAFVDQEWNQVFTGNRTRLKVVGLERMRRLPREPTVPLEQEYVLPNVTSLDLSIDPLSHNQTVAHYNNVLAFAWMLPNLSVVDLSFLTVSENSSGAILSCMEDKCRRLQKIIWKGSQLCS